MTGLALALLGSFQATLNGIMIAGFESDRVRALLAYLAVEPDRSHRRETLTGLLWPDWPDTSALTNLRNSLANLRKAIGDREAAIPTILANRETLQFNRESGSWVDVQTFRRLTDPGQSITRQEEGIALYRGPFLEGFGLKDSPLFEEWQQQVRDQLQRECLAALERVSEHYEQSGKLDQAMRAALRQIDLAPWQEEAHRRLMRLLARSGQRSAALAQYETCRHLLQKELGVDVSAETTQLYQRIQQGEIAAHKDSPGGSGSPTHLLPSPDLPTWQIPFVGRQALTAEIRERLSDADCRLLTLIGPGGSGKTRLAVETAARQAQAFPDGVFFAMLAALQPDESIVPAVAQALGFPIRENEEPQAQVLNYLRSKTLLLVLDNFEHLQGQAGFVAEILRAAPRVKIIATSQVRLNLSGEQLVQISGMEVPAQPPASLAEAEQSGSLKLFLEGARRVAPSFEPAPADLEQIVRVCRLVQGTPLAILLAAGWMRLLSPAEIAAEIESHSLDFLESEWQDVPARQRSLRAVFDYSWRLLDERERQVFTGLAVFRGDFSYPAAQQVCQAALRDLMNLVNHSLLERTANGRYQLHELVGQYGEEKLRENPDQEQNQRDRHAAFYTSALKKWGAQLKSSLQLEALAAMDLEIDNIRAGWSWAVERRQVERLEEGWEGLTKFYMWRRHLSEGGLPFLRAFEMLEGGEYASQPRWFGLQAVLLALYSFLLRPSNWYRFTKDKYMRSMELVKKAAESGQDVRRYQAYILWMRGIVYDEDINERKEIIAASEALFKELNDRWGVAQALSSLGGISQVNADYPQAVRSFQQSIEIFKELGGRLERVETEIYLAGLLSVIGRLEESEKLGRECEAFYRQQGDQPGLAQATFHLAATLGMEGKYRDACWMIEESISICEKYGDHFLLARVLMRQGVLKFGLGEYDQAQAILQRSFALYQVTGWSGGPGAVKRHLGELAMVAGQWAEAHALLQESIADLQRVGADGMISHPLAFLGITDLKLNDLGQAQKRLGEALTIVSETHEYVSAMNILACALLIYLEKNQLERGVELYALASRYPYFTNTAYLQELVNPPYAALSSTLPPAVLAAAEQRGQQRELWATIDELLVEFGGRPG